MLFEGGYTRGMKRQVLSLFPAEFRKNPVHFQALGLALVFTVLALAQLFTFEHFGEVTLGYGLPGGMFVATLLAFLLPAAEIISLPYLLSMRLSANMYFVSRISVIVTGSLWVCVAVWTNLTGNADTNAGIFGATLHTPNQWWFIIFVLFLFWASWLMYTAKPHRGYLHRNR